MRSTLITAVSILGLGLGSLTAAPLAMADETTVPALTTEVPVEALASEAAPVDPGMALDTAERVLDGEASPRDPSATVALRDLWLARPTMEGEEGRRADSILARPTDGAGDRYGDGYTQPATSTCGTALCLHYVPTSNAYVTPDEADPAWAEHSRAVMESTWDVIVNQLGYRAPLGDGVSEGDARFDVYLKDLGSGLYGYCAPEQPGPANTAAGFCVLDDDYDPVDFPGNTPEGNLRVTAAHEFFHAVQYAYDAFEDRWLLESTATWMEERVATDVDDNRQYLYDGQLYGPGVPLDTFERGLGNQYGNWIWFEYLSTRMGVDVVRQLWQLVGSLPGDGGKNSAQALRVLLGGKTGFAHSYADFANSNFAPHRTYPEGRAYTRPSPDRQVKVRASRRMQAKSFRIDHLSSASMSFKPTKTMQAKKWRLRVQVKGPKRATAPYAMVMIWMKDGTIKQRPIRLNGRGDGSKRVPFSYRKVRRIIVTMANASTRYRCDRGTNYICSGKPKDNRQAFTLRYRATK